ncbi:MAG: NADH-quinone oxidoreductase subunit A [Chloroflexota bacterium]|nr:NADH-quinone oxidoreductase subunit A [Chloroflexota bacterium]
MVSNYWPIAIFFVIVIGFALASLAMSRLIAPHKPSPIKAETYESGIEAIGTAQQRFDVRFYTIAMLFVLFDIEAVFLYPWAVVYDRIGLYGLVEMVLFIALLLVAYAYAWRKGALDWA